MKLKHCLTPLIILIFKAIQGASNVQETSPMTKLQSSQAANMLQQLIAEAENNSVVYSDDLSVVCRQQHLQGVQACQEDDVQHKNWQSTHFCSSLFDALTFTPFF